jgi:hypothetical protein
VFFYRLILKRRAMGVRVRTVCQIFDSVLHYPAQLSCSRPISHLLFNQLMNTCFHSGGVREMCLFLRAEESHGSQSGLIIARGDRGWLMRVYLALSAMF